MDTTMEFNNKGLELQADLTFLENEINAFQAVFDELTGKCYTTIYKCLFLFSDQNRSCRKDNGNITTKMNSLKPALKPKPIVRVKPKLMPKPKLDTKLKVLSTKE